MVFLYHHSSSSLVAMIIIIIIISIAKISYCYGVSAKQDDDDDDDLTVCETPSPNLEGFVDEVTFPPVLRFLAENNYSMTLGAFKIKQKLHRDLPNTTLYAYGTSPSTASYPGPTLLAQVGVPVHVKWENHIEDHSHMLGTDNAIPWANPNKGGVPIVTHLHGGEVESSSDGHPNAWYTIFNETGDVYEKNEYTYANSQRPSTLWYHDHTHGITRFNLYAGLMGVYIVTDNYNETMRNLNENGNNEYGKDWDAKQNLNVWRLPLGLPLLIRDWRFFDNGTLNFPLYVEVQNKTTWCAEYGDIMLVNGIVTPFLRVQPKQYRFRLLNGCNGRFLELTLSHPKLSFLRIGSDAGPLSHSMRQTILLFSPGERVDVLIDFSSLEEGGEIMVINTANAPYPTGKMAYKTNGTFYVMKFIVDTKGGINDGIVSPPMTKEENDLDNDEDANVAIMSRYGTLDMEMVKNELNATIRSFIMTSFYGKLGEPNHQVLDNTSWLEPVKDFPLVGSTEIWELINLGLDAHNMHLHLVSFMVLNQQSFSVDGYENGTCALDLPYPHPESCFSEEPQPPNDDGLGWKDTIIAWPGNVTRLLMKFVSANSDNKYSNILHNMHESFRTTTNVGFPFDPTLGPGYVWHCHTADHEDYEMMRPFQLRLQSQLSTLLK